MESAQKRGSTHDHGELERPALGAAWHKKSHIKLLYSLKRWKVNVGQKIMIHPKGTEKFSWQPVFAWWPVIIHGKIYWLKTVYRIYKYNTKYGLRIVPIYGTLIDVFKDSV